MNKKIMYTFIPAIAAIGALVGFKSNSYRVTSNNDVVTSNSDKTMNVTNNHCNDEHEHEGWTELTQDDITESTMSLVGGKYYLGSDIDLSACGSSWEYHGFAIMGSQTEVEFCLNGHSIKGYKASESNASINNNIFTVDSSCTLKLHDCNGANQKHYFIEHDANNPDNNYWIPSPNNEVTPLSLDGGYLYCDNCSAVGNKGTFIMDGGSIVGYSTTNSKTGGFGSDNTIISTPANATNTFINIENGNIVGCNASDIIYGGTDSTISISGGEVKKTYAKESIIYNSSKTEMTGGKIHNCYTGDGDKTNAILLNKNSSEALIAGTAEITDNITLLNYVSPGKYTAGSVVTYDTSTTIELGGTAKVIRNRTSTDMDSEHTYAKKIETTELANIVIHNASSGGANQPVITPIISDDHPHVLKKGARFGVRTLNEGGEATIGYVFSKVPSDTSYKQFFFSDNSNRIVAEVTFPTPRHQLQLNQVNSIDINAQITKKGEMPSKKPILDNAILLKGKLDKSIEVVIKDKEDLGPIKETVEVNIKKELTTESNLISQFDISLESDGVEIENIDGNYYGVTLKLPDNYAGLKKQKVIYIKDDGSIETKDTKVTGNKCYFETDHFSTWGFAAEGKLGVGLSGGAIAGIVLGTAAGGGGIYFVVFMIFIKKKLRFFVNGYKVYEERLKRNEDIDFTNSYVAGKQWYSDKECTKPFTKTKMGLLNKSVYTKSDDTYGGNRYNLTQVNSKCKLIISLKNKVKSLFKKKNKDKPEEQNNVAPEEQNNNNQNE